MGKSESLFLSPLSRLKETHEAEGECDTLVLSILSGREMRSQVT